jgi:hypothetical protein
MGVMTWALPAPLPEPRGRPQVRGTADVIEQRCREAGWVFVSREVDLYRVRSGDYKSPVYIDIRSSERFSSAVFMSWFPIRFSLEKPPAGLFARVLLRSLSLTWGSWQMSIGQSSEACLCVRARLPAAALTAELFRDVCEEIAGEIRAFHQELHDKFAYNMGTVMTDGPTPGGRGGLAVRQDDNLPGVWYVE